MCQTTDHRLYLELEAIFPINGANSGCLFHSWAGQSQCVKLLITDSVFEPEDWSRTFLEGCLRRPASKWKDADVLEVGTGCVWKAFACMVFV